MSIRIQHRPAAACASCKKDKNYWNQKQYSNHVFTSSSYFFRYPLPISFTQILYLRRKIYFTSPLAYKQYSFRYSPVYDPLHLIISSGFPSNIILPPFLRLRPKSIIQSAALMTSRLCSITSTVLPASTSL